MGAAPQSEDFFSASGRQQQAGVLNTLLSAAGPAVLSQLAGSPAASGLASLLSGNGISGLSSLLGGHNQVSPEQAAQVAAEMVQQLAAHVEQHDPGIVDRISQIYSEHPSLIKTLGGAALGIALTKLADRNR